jgi:hypothetical protein
MAAGGAGTARLSLVEKLPRLAMSLLHAAGYSLARGSPFGPTCTSDLVPALNTFAS